MQGKIVKIITYIENLEIIESQENIRAKCDK